LICAVNYIDLLKRSVGLRPEKWRSARRKTMLYVQKSAISSGRLTLLISTLHYTGEEFKDVIKDGEHPVAGRCAYQTGTNKKGGSAKGTAILFLYKKL